jgi:hypothetical protein
VNAENCEFRFIADAKLRDTLQRHYAMIRATFDKACYPWTILLAGRSIEAILLDGLNVNWVKALASQKAPKGNSDIDTWNLADLIGVSADQGLVSGGVDELPRSVVHWRDLMRGNLPATDIETWKEEARIAIEVLLKIHRWLS